MKKFLLGKTPIIRSVDNGGVSTNRMMIDLLIALTPITIFAWVKNGLLPFINLPGVSVLSMLYPLLFVIAGGLTSFVLEALYFYCFLNVRDFRKLLKTVWESYAIIPGIMLALSLPLNTNILYLVFGCFLANIVFKMLFGGLGKNVFNPALIAYIILVVTFPLTSGNLNPTESLEIVSGATPLGNLTSQFTAGTVTFESVVAPYGSLLDFFIGTVPGCLGGTSILLCLVGYIYLVARKVIKWQVPVFFIGSFAVMALIIALVNGYGLWYVPFQICTGGLVFGAVFMATEPVTTPRNPLGKVIYAIGCGLLTCLLRFGLYPDGAATAILLMCLFTPVIDGAAAKIRANKLNTQSIVKLSIVGVIYVVIAVFTVLKAGGKF